MPKLSKTFALIMALSLSSVTYGLSCSQGGVSGGGGNVINPTPPDEIADSEQVEHLVKASVVYTHIYFKNVHAQYLAGEIDSDIKPVFEKLFADRKLLKRTLSEVRPHVENERPCFDRELKPVDASIVNSKAGRFCVSAYSVGQKVDVSEIPIQSAALMAHEYSELMGLDENEAVTVQKKALEDLSSTALPPLDEE